MNKETISLSKRIWSKIRYYQMLYDITESELAEIIHVTTRTLKTYDKDASNLTLGAIDSYLEYMDLSLEELYGTTKPVQSDISCIGEYYLTDDIRRKRKLFHEGLVFKKNRAEKILHPLFFCLLNRTYVLLALSPDHLITNFCPT